MGKDAKVIILATGLDNKFMPDESTAEERQDDNYYNQIISKLYREPLEGCRMYAKKAEDKPTETPAKDLSDSAAVIKPEEQEDDAPVTVSVDYTSRSEPDATPNSASQSEPKNVNGGQKPSHKTFLEKLKEKLAKNLNQLTMDEDD